MSIDCLVEGVYADQYTGSAIQQEIKEKYVKRFPNPVQTPQTHPWKYDPLTPPTGWRYDPYYEIWLNTKETK